MESRCDRDRAIERRREEVLAAGGLRPLPEEVVREIERGLTFYAQEWVIAREEARLLREYGPRLPTGLEWRWIRLMERLGWWRLIPRWWREHPTAADADKKWRTYAVLPVEMGRGVLPRHAPTPAASPPGGAAGG
jgi:hypothetical protein